MLNAQNPEKGALNIRSYSPQEYGAHAQNLCIAQDKRGVMYFGNNSGVLEYDGTFWNLIDISSGKTVHVIGVDTTGRIYVGADSDFGYLHPNANGKLEFVSLKPFIPAEESNELSRFVGLFATPEGIFFIGKDRLFIWNGVAMKVFHTEPNIHTSFYAGGKIYVSQKGKGISTFSKGVFTVIEGTEFLSNYNVYDISVFRGNVIITTSDSGIYYLSGNVLRKVKVDVNNVYNAINVFNAYFAIGLFGDGMVVLNKELEKEYLIGLSNGLEEGTVNDIFVDREQNVWLALGRGLAKIELVSPISLHNFGTGLKGTVQDVVRCKGVLYASTSNGVFYIDPKNPGEKNFKQVPLSIDCYGMGTFIFGKDTLLLVSGVDGVYEVDRDRKPLRIFEGFPWTVKQSVTYSNRIIIAEEGSLASMVRIDGRWEAEGRVEGIEADVTNFVEETNGDLWLGTTDMGVIRTTTKIFKDKKTEILFYDESFGLTEGPVVITQNKAGDLYFGTDNGVCRFDEKKQRFFQDEKYKVPTKTGKSGIHRLSFDAKGQLWVAVFYDEGKSYDIMYYRNNSWYKTPFLRYNSEIFHCIYHEPRGITWLGSAAGLLRYDQEFLKDYQTPYHVGIRRVLSGNNPIFEGAFFDQDSVLLDLQPEDADVTLTFSQNNLTFEFSALTYFDELGTEYSYMLEGQTEDWSNWSTNPRAIFTNIPEGSYTFKVKARNIYDIESPVSEYRFVILPPWYRTLWAYIGYVILFIAFVWGAISVSTRSLRNIIEERTAEITLQKEEIEKQKEIVEEKNKDILDSIKYAKRIQDAILPEEDMMREVMGKDLFVLFQPKDIVSGDFYWMRVKGPKVLFAAVDCTGHGVPGAFVSIVGNNGLNRAVNEFNLTQPAAILDNLTASVEDSFRQQGHSDVRDGMDISLCSLEMTGFNQALLEWAGANNPLWIIRKDNPSVVEEYKADKQPIGRFENRKPFTNQQFELKKGDTIYVFTDGYADQFGGPAGKKFKYSQMKEFILSIQEMDMIVQRNLLLERFTHWKSELEQIDDVCVIGVRI
ncbi:MAG: SpoIIE family protein phosphatase [Flavobacteriales bacterium]